VKVGDLVRAKGLNIGLVVKYKEANEEEYHYPFGQACVLIGKDTHWIAEFDLEVINESR
tara:strand:+ start:455 stop:631 length:177 start_codon:yes stop_codon:yes gene_type:complete